MRGFGLLALLGCGGGGTANDKPAIDAPVVEIDARPIDAPGPFYMLGGMCGVLNDPELTGTAPLLVKDAMTFARRYNDPADRPLLTPGGRTIIETPNAGGSSIYSEV